MINCPILGKEMRTEDCLRTKDTVNLESLDDSDVLKKVKRVNGWRFICKNCSKNK